MFTKGPWKIGVAGPNGCPTVGTTTGLMVCHIAHSINEDDQKSQALGNARLIKAAPEMFELLNEARDFIASDLSIGPAGLGLICVIDNLLAEIRGETA